MCTLTIYEQPWRDTRAAGDGSKFFQNAGGETHAAAAGFPHWIERAERPGARRRISMRSGARTALAEAIRSSQCPSRCCWPRRRRPKEGSSCGATRGANCIRRPCPRRGSICAVSCCFAAPIAPRSFGHWLNACAAAASARRLRRLNLFPGSRPGGCNWPLNAVGGWGFSFAPIRRGSAAITRLPRAG